MNVFIKAQVNSVFSTLVDFGVTILLKQVVGAWYLAAGVAGAITGGIVNFLAGRYWVFKASQEPRSTQILRYLLVWTGSLFLNTAGLYCFTDLLGIHYLVSKTIVMLAVAVGYNFVMHKYFVFAR